MSQRGFTITEVMIATVMMSMAGVAVLSLSQLANQDSLQLRATRVAFAGRAQIEAALKNPAAWRQTVAQNASFGCATLTPGCNVASTNGGYYNFVVYGIKTTDKVTYDANDATTRLSIQGGACASGTANPSSQCPLKYLASWKPLCQSYPCLNPTLDIKISLATEFGINTPVFNPAKYQYVTVRSLGDGSLQSACTVLNGVYNSASGTCFPKYASKTCASIGKPAQIVTAVASDGTITCSPLYSGQCNAATQIVRGISSTGAVQCAARTQPANCPTPCVGAWGACSKTCGGGLQTYSVISPATNGGAACTAPSPGATQACNTQACPVNCVGSFGACSQACGGGTMTYSIAIPASGGGAACAYKSGDTVSCNTQACPVPVDCGGTWSSCSPITGTKTFTVTQAAQNGGASCPSPLTQACAVDCVGSWGSCQGSPAYRTYTWTTPPLNGGSTATCAYANGQTDNSACGTPGVCGSSNGQSFSSKPSTGLCAVGSPTGVSASGSNFSWSCVGTSGSASCSASLSCSMSVYGQLCPGVCYANAVGAPGGEYCASGSGGGIAMGSPACTFGFLGGGSIGYGVFWDYYRCN